MPSDRPDVILLDGVEVPAALGVTRAERGLRRPVRIDLEVHFDLRRAGRSDRVGNTIDYGAIYDAVCEVAGQQEHRLVEALAERIATALLAGFPITACTVTVRKPTPLAGNLREAGVRIHREKDL